MRIPVAFRILFAVLISMYACLVHAQDADDHQYTSESIRIGYGIYGQQCRLCHGSNGDVVDGVNLRLGIFPNARSDEDLRRVITEGAAEGRMPAINISEQEVTGIIAYIRAGFNSEYEVVDIGDPVRGKALFEGEGRCASCHRVAGVGPRTAPDLSAIGLVRTATTLQLNMIDPAAALLPINKQVRIVTIAEETIIGRRLNEDTFTVQVLDSQERLRSLRKSDIATYEISDVPTKQPTTLSSEEVADVVAYLLTLRGL